MRPPLFIAHIRNHTSKEEMRKKKLCVCFFSYSLLVTKCTGIHALIPAHQNTSSVRCLFLLFFLSISMSNSCMHRSAKMQEREREEKKKITGSLLRVFACKVTIQMMSENRKIKWFNKHIESTNTHSDIHDMNVEWTWYSIIGCNQIFAYLISFRFVSFFRCEPLNALQLQTEWFRSQRWCTKFKFGVIVSVSVCVTQYVYPQLGCWW